MTEDSIRVISDNRLAINEAIDELEEFRDEARRVGAPTDDLDHLLSALRECVKRLESAVRHLEEGRLILLRAIFAVGRDPG